MSVVGAGLDRDERALLAILRHFLQTFAQPESHGWARGLDLAFGAFPEADAPQLWLGALALVQSLRGARHSGFVFSNPDCPTCSQKLTAEERQLIGVIMATRRGQRSRASTHALLLCEGNDIGPVLGAAQHLCRLLDGAINRRRLLRAEGLPM